jgi:hypothetical protein
MATSKHSEIAYLWHTDHGVYVIAYGYRDKTKLPFRMCLKTKRRREWAVAWLERMGYTLTRTLLSGSKEEWRLKA